MSTVRAAGSISGPTLLSRILGMVRDSIMMSVMGVNWASGVFQLAWMVPNMTRRLFGEGALSASFVPRYASTLEKEGPEAARSLLGTVAGTMGAFLVGMAAVAVGLCVVLPAGTLGLGVDDPAVADTAADALFFELSAVLLPYLVPICLVALLAGALNSHGVFALPAFGPVLLNLFWIAGLLLAGWTGRSGAAEVARFVAWFLLAAGCAQLVVAAWALHQRKALARPRVRIPPPGDPARAVFLGMVPAILGLSLTQLNTLIDQAMAVSLVAPGANNYVYLANRLLLFPHALTSMAMAVAVFPKLSVLASTGETAGFHRELDRVLGFAVFLALPASAGLILVGHDLIPLLFEHGAFTAENSRETWWATTLLVAGLPALGVAQLYARGLYALGDLKNPARIAAILVVVNLGLNLLFVLGTDLGAAGLTLATTVSGVLNAVALGVLLQVRCPGRPSWFGSAGRSALATAAMFAVVILVQNWLPATGDGSRLLRVLLTVVPGMAIYGGTHVLLGSPELAKVRQKLQRRRR